MKKKIQAIWGVPSWTCTGNHSVNVSKYGISENSDQSYVGGTEFVIFYESTFGAVPYFQKYNTSRPLNGGLPQLADLNLHLWLAAQDIVAKIPDENYAGVAVIDIEEWRPLYKLNWGDKKVYQQESMRLVQQQHPGWPDNLIKQRAEKEFDRAAREFFLETLRLGKKLRPLAKWGYYLFPMCNGNIQKSGVGACNRAFQKYNDELLYLYRESTALFPSIYYYNQTNSSENFWNTAAVIDETNRMASSIYPRPSVLVFTKFEYNPYDDWTSFYSPEDLANSIATPMQMSVDGLIFWSTSKKMKQRCEGVAQFVEKYLGPKFAETSVALSNCGVRLCSGRGICFLKKARPTPSVEDFSCDCNKPYYGDHCEYEATQRGLPYPFDYGTTYNLPYYSEYAIQRLAVPWRMNVKPQEPSLRKPGDRVLIRDRCGLLISLKGLWPLSDAEEEPRRWTGSIILNSSELEFPRVEYKLRAHTRRRCRDDVICSHGVGVIKKDDIVVVNYQMPEEAISVTSLTLIVDGSPHDVPLYKEHKADYYWLGYDTRVPTLKELAVVRPAPTSVSPMTSPMTPTPKAVPQGSFARVDSLPVGLKNYLLGCDGLDSVCRLVLPHVKLLFRELAEHPTSSRKFMDLDADHNLGEAFTEEVLRRFHDSNREDFPTTPALFK
ncbi:unnamed protein product [Caenorhabditis auriculariae]|uniref:Hyaluronidase n=1 Tax=Caenorhabditis auriculariae TaxID=2777116 RepID=A0A8S1H3M6_9PELO|nr:unnamed protein product [Caenorhabditis auriculariae]